jgi:ABC-type glycerol-3-phosphate transport system substrate-binding protein
MIQELQNNAPEIFENTGILPPLVGPGGPEAAHIVSFANPWMIYSQTEHPEEAKIFLRWMMEPENLAKQTVENGVDYWYPNNAAAVGIGSMGTSLTDLIVNPVVSGNRSPEDALADAQAQLEPLFQQAPGS